MTREYVSGDRVGVSPADSAESQIGVFVLNGDYWRLTFAGTTISIKEAKGLHYLQRLLQYPGKDFHVFELLNDGAPAVGDKDSVRDDANIAIRDLGDAGEILDSQAVKAYKEKLADLRDELEDARELGHIERSEQLQSEIDFLAREITGALGLGGRHRRAGSATERARLNVSRAINTSIAKITEMHRALGDHFHKCVTTGTFCVYSADSKQPITWHFSEQTEAPIATVVPRRLLVDEPALSSSADRTAFVGRRAEQDSILARLEQARLGHGRVILLSGAAGVGKTRLASEIAAAARGLGFLTLSGSCYDRELREPFSPFVEMLETALARASDLKAFRDYLASDAGEAARLLPQLRRIYPDLPEPMELPAEQSRRVLFNAVSALISRSAQNRPVLMLLDDLHWSDEGTLLLMSHLAQSVTTMPMLMVATYRDYELTAAGPLAKAIEELIRRKVVDCMTLTGLPEDAVAQMLSQLDGRELPDTAVRWIHTVTDGNPFFVEEIYRYLSEQGKLEDPKALSAIVQLNEGDAPPSIRLIVERRLARLTDQTRKALNAAAIIGRSSTYELLAAVSGIDSEALLDNLDEAEKAGLIVSVSHYPDSLFQFCHELARQAVIGTLSQVRQQRTHLRAAQALEQLYASTLEDHADDIAYHLWKAGSAADKEKTFQYFIMAGKRARSQGAFESAFAHLSHALELLKERPESPERDKAELELYFDYLPVLHLTHLWTTSAAGRAHFRARELCTRLGQSSRMHGVLVGSALYHMGRGEWQLVNQYARQLMELSHSAERPDWTVAANYLLGQTLCCVGNLADAHRHLDEAAKLNDALLLSTRVHELPPSTVFGFNDSHAGIYGRGVDAMALWMLGYPDRAKSKCDEAVVIARQINDDYSLTLDLSVAHIVLLFLRDFPAALAASQEALNLAEKKFPFMRTVIAWTHNACRILAGMEQSISVARRDFDTYFGAEARMYKPRCCAVLAECYGMVGNPELGLPMIDEAISAAEETGERMAEPDTWRIKGDLILQLAATRRDADMSVREAEGCYRRAIDESRRQDARSWELRSALSLSRLLMNENRNVEAQQTLAGVYNWFSEGFDTPDLMDAAALLKKLSLILDSESATDARK